MAEQFRVYRYNEISRLSTTLDPLSDVISWIRGLRSTEYVMDLLREKHSLRRKQLLTKSARSISAHADIAINLIDQALSGDPRISYLPIYYAILNLSKILVVANGLVNDLEDQRHHGVYWSGQSTTAHSLFTDHITLSGSGTFPLLYQSLTGGLWPRVRKIDKNGDPYFTHHRIVQLRNIYPYIPSVSHEFSLAHGDADSNFSVFCHIVEKSQDTHYLDVQFFNPGVGTEYSRREFRLLKGLIHRGDATYRSQYLANSTMDDAQSALLTDFPRYLLYDSYNLFVQEVIIKARTSEYYASLITSTTPRSTSDLLLPEEIPLFLVFFHLSNVVRYDPERIFRLFDSRCASLLESLVHHGVYRYMIITWSYLMQCSILLSN